MFLNKISIPLAACLIWLSFGVVFASNVDALQSAITQNNIAEVKILLSQGIDPQQIESLRSLPSYAVSTLLLKNKKPLAVSKLFYLILSMDYKLPNGDIKTELLQQRQSLLQALIKDNANANLLLEMAVNSTWKIENGYMVINLVNQDALIRLALNHKAQFSRITYYLYNLPSVAVAKLILENPLNPKNTLSSSVFLGRVMNACSYSENNPATINLQHQLMELALKNNADFNQVDNMHSLPTYEIANLLLKRKDFVDQFFNLILRVSCFTKRPAGNGPALINEQDVQHKNALIDLALKAGADIQNIKNYGPEECKARHVTPGSAKSMQDLDFLLNCIDSAADYKQKLLAHVMHNEISPEQVKYPELLDAINQKKKFIGQEQSLITNKLGAFYKDTSSDYLATIFTSSNGRHCMGLSTLWLYAKWLQFTQPDNADLYNGDWFKQTVKNIISGSGNSQLTSKEMLDMQRFGAIINLFQNPILGLTQADIDKSFTFSLLDTHGVNLGKKYTLVSMVDSVSLQVLLKEIVFEDELVFVMHPGHATAVFKHDENYYFYDPNSPKGEYQDVSLEELAKTILKANTEMSGFAKGCIGFIVIGDVDSQKQQYPDKTTILTKINSACDKETALRGAFESIATGCLESLRFFLEAGKIRIDKDRQDGVSLFAVSVIIKQLAAMQMLLQRGADPNQLFVPEEQQYTTTALNFAASANHIGLASVLVKHKQIKLDLANPHDGKTALMLAAEKGHSKIVELLVQCGANIYKKDHQGKTALMLAQEKAGDHYEAIAKLLTNHE